ncbi:MAG TPA: hypothetical protein VIG88_05905 [Lysobacter sp.]
MQLGLLLTLLAATFRIDRPRIRTLATALTVGLFLRAHGIDLALAASGAYCFGLLALGRSAEQLLFRGADPEGQLCRSVLLALSIFTLSLWLPSLGVGLGFKQAQVLGISLAGLGWALELARRPWQHLDRLVIPRAPDVPMALVYALGVTCLLAVLARSNIVLYYDSIWYGLRPDRVLFGTHGIFNFLGLTTQVHYYPKLYEVVLAPLQGYGDISFETGFNVWSLLLLAVAIFQLAVRARVPKRHAVTIAVVLLCFPAFAGVAETTKGDLLAAVMVLYSLQALQRSITTRDLRPLAEVLSCALLATGLRLSVLPWLALLGALTVGWWVRRSASSPREAFVWLRGAPGTLVALCLAAVALVHYRTWLLTGTPLITNSNTQLLLASWGFEIRFPIGTLTGGERAPGIAGLREVYGIALNPSAYTYQIFKWMGAIWLVGGAWALVRAFFAFRSPVFWPTAGLPLAVGLGMPALLCLNAWPVPGGDGNYFLVPIATLTVAGFAYSRPSKLVDWCLLLCGGLGLYCFVLTSCWTVGLGRPQWNMKRSPFDAQHQVGAYISSVGLMSVSRYFESCSPHTRVVGLLPDTGQAFALPVRFEPLQEWNWNNSKSIASNKGIQQLLAATGTQFVVLPASDKSPLAQGQPALYAAIDTLLKNKVDQNEARLTAEVGAFRIYQLLDASPARCLSQSNNR